MVRCHWAEIAFSLEVDFDDVFSDLTKNLKSTALQGLTNLVLGNYQQRNEARVAKLVARPCIKASCLPRLRPPGTTNDSEFMRT